MAEAAVWEPLCPCSRSIEQKDWMVPQLQTMAPLYPRSLSVSVEAAGRAWYSDPQKGSVGAPTPAASSSATDSTRYARVLLALILQAGLAFSLPEAVAAQPSSQTKANTKLGLTAVVTPGSPHFRKSPEGVEAAY